MKITALACVILASIFCGLYALSAFLENGREAQARQAAEFELYELRQRQIREDVILSDFVAVCAEYGAEPIMIEGEVYCIHFRVDEFAEMATPNWLKENVP